MDASSAAEIARDAVTEAVESLIKASPDGITISTTEGARTVQVKLTATEYAACLNHIAAEMRGWLVAWFAGRE